MTTLTFLAARARQSPEHDVLTFAATADQVLQFAEIDRVGRDQEGTLRGFQRPQIAGHIREIRDYLATGELPPRPSKEEVRDMMLRHTRMEIEYKGEYTGIREMRKHVAWYTKGMPGSAKLRDEINKVESYQELEQLLEEKY